MLSLNALKGIVSCLLVSCVLTQVQAQAGNVACSVDAVVLTATRNAQTLTSPNYPFEYDNGAICNWRILAPDDSIVKIIVQYDIEYNNSDDCEFDGLRIYDGPIERNCLTTLCDVSDCTEEYFTNYNEVNVGFYSDGSIAHTGFSLTYKYVDADTASGNVC